MPSYSTLTVISVFSLLTQLAVNLLARPIFSQWLIWLWVAVVGALFVYPLFGLALEKAPFRAYLAIMSGPFFILWRTWLALNARFGGKEVAWVRTAHGGQK